MNNMTRLLITTSHGLYLCASRLLFPVWELPVMVVKGESSDDMEIENGFIVCRILIEAMQILENKTGHWNNS